MKCASRTIYDFVKEEENAKDSKGQPAAIAGEKRKGFDKRAVASMAEEGQVYAGKALHTRRAVGNREKARAVDNAKYAEKTSITEVTQSGQKAPD